MIQTRHSPLDTWEQAIEDGTSISLGRDPYGIENLAKNAQEDGITYIHIPITQSALHRIHQKAEAQNKTTTTYLSEVVEHV